MAMSKKDYQAIAAEFYQTKQASELSHESYELWQLLTFNLATLFSDDNPRFSRDRFIEACETGKTRGMKAVA